MKLLTVMTHVRTEAQAEHAARMFKLSGELLHNANKIQITADKHGGTLKIDLSGRLPDFQLQRDGEIFLAEAAEALASYIMQEEEERLLCKLIRVDFHYKQEAEIEQILTYCDHILNDAEEVSAASASANARKRRKEKLAGEIEAYIRTETELHIDGLLRFRLQAYKQELREVAEYAIDEFMMDRQYQEFISLLQYFVYIQEAKIPFVHLVHKGGSEFKLLNDRMEEIEPDDPEAVVTVEMLEKDMNFEDMIVSTLITVSPQTIYIHTREPEAQVIRTIRQIFENRVELCGYCRLCQNLDRSAAAEYNKI
ncbi:putative sporulation protein YtxC [Paenibacillus sp. UNCCL117]|uniref:putative sporulation protein YtxC n=1 Tax=unclassified Paenibacillus TaxID=185978 RepID=UPI000880F46C|nr:MULTISPECIES: putative sporulation protein YtxC [unclassified Paenibacillus]SDC01685.1 putative sporulation protein YtxC [Paenibacillus sp. cl123]SFW36683.1 putative sporulation protein YtxC [Paenibacillus sp. UNCCL117]